MKIPIILFVLLSSCIQIGSGQTEKAASDKILILYLSRTNNTKAIAEIIHDEVGGDLVALELQNPYPEDYDAIVRQVADENESGFLPALKPKVEIEKYDIIFLGFPTWGMQLPPPMKSFLSENNLNGKTIIPFNTNAGYGVGSSIKTINGLCPNSKILKSFQIKGGIERDEIYLVIKGEKREKAQQLVVSWLRELKLLEAK